MDSMVNALDFASAALLGAKFQRTITNFVAQMPFEVEENEKAWSDGRAYGVLQ